MGHINTSNLPTYAPDTQGVGGKPRSGDGPAASTAAVEITEPQDDLQLTRLSTVLNGLKKGASAVRTQVSQVMGAVRAGSYQVDAMAVSRSIVGDSLAQQ